MDSDHSIKDGPSKGASVSHSSGGKVPYPKHVWSPAGGWYTQPANWRTNTAIMIGVVFGITAMTWNLSAKLEDRPRMPDRNRWFPSRYWSKQIIEHERAEDVAKAAGGEGQ